MFPSDRKQSVDLQSKSTDWFLFDGNIGRWRVRLSSATEFIIGPKCRLEDDSNITNDMTKHSNVDDGHGYL